jgi:hypothetical protein
MSGHIRFPAAPRALAFAAEPYDRVALLEAQMLAEFGAALLPSEAPTPRERALRDLADDPTLFADAADGVLSLAELARSPHLVHERANMAVVA